MSIAIILIISHLSIALLFFNYTKYKISHFWCRGSQKTQAHTRDDDINLNLIWGTWLQATFPCARIAPT